MINAINVTIDTTFFILSMKKGEGAHPPFFEIVYDLFVTLIPLRIPHRLASHTRTISARVSTVAVSKVKPVSGAVAYALETPSTTDNASRSINILFMLYPFFPLDYFIPEEE